MAKKNVLKLKIAKIINEIQTEREKRKVYDQARYKVKRDVEILNKKGEELC